MDIFSAASHHDILVLVIQIAVLLLVARTLGEIVTRMGQPSVIGEILAGILLGPSLLSGAVPAIGEYIIPQTDVQGYLLEVISLLGAMFLLLITGLETDIKLIRRHAKTAVSVSLGGITFTFFTGFLLGQNLPEFLLVDPDERLVFSLFVATAMAISAIPVIAKVLMDMNLMRRDIGQTILAAGMSDDTIGWILLSVVAGIAAGDAVTTGTVMTTIGSVLAFMIFSFTIGRWMVRKLLMYVQDEVVSPDRLLSLVVILMFAWGAITQALNLEAILGAFVMGILFGTMPRLPDEVRRKLESLALGIFAPVFFAVAGLKVNIINLFDPVLIVITLIVIAIATLGKVAGTYFGARVIGRKDHWTSLSFGAGLNARGAMEIIIATIGLRLGILTQDMFSIIVVMAMATSLMAPSALKWVLGKVKIGKEEEDRLKKEELEEGSIVADIHRVLLPVRRRETIPDKPVVQSIEARILALLGNKNVLSVTIMTVASKGSKEQCEGYLGELAKLFEDMETTTKVVVGEKAENAILNEAEKDYDLLVLGATEKATGRRHLFSSFIDYVTRVSPCPTMVVQPGKSKKVWAPKRILVPTNGTNASNNAAELGFALVQGEPNSEVVGLHAIIEDNLHEHSYRVNKGSDDSKKQIGKEIIEQFKERGEGFDVKTQAILQSGKEPEQVILNFAEENDIDLIILGTNTRPGSSRLYLGPRVENILGGANCPVIIFNT